MKTHTILVVTSIISMSFLTHGICSEQELTTNEIAANTIKNTAMIEKLEKEVDELKELVKQLATRITGNAGLEEYKVIKIIDGDTIEVKDDNNIITRIRLLNINTPEMGRIYSYEAKEFLASCIDNKVIKLKSNGEYDEHGRLLGTIYYNNENINERIIRAGWAKTFMTSGNSINLYQAQEAAKNDKVGLWQVYKIPKNFNGVLVTTNGDKYHQEGCWYIKDKSVIPIPYAELPKYSYIKCHRFKGKIK